MTPPSVRLLPTVLHGLDLPLAELCAAKLDGEVVTVGDGFLPIDQADNATARACIIRTLAGSTAVAECASALWLYGIVDRPPHIHTVCVTRSQRSMVPRGGRLKVRERLLASADIVAIGSMKATSPQCTVLDLLRGQIFGSEERAAVRTLFEAHSVDAASCDRRIRAVRNLPGRHAALARLSALSPC